MLSRVAERTYWLARYLERAENTARLIGVYSALLLDLPKSTQIGWDVVLQSSGCGPAFAVAQQERSDANILRYLLHDDSNVGSLLNSLSYARENVRTTRDIVPNEGWRAINELVMYSREYLPKATHRRQRAQVMAHLLEKLQSITGLLDGTMSHGQPYQFIMLGRNIERADMTTRMIDVAAAVLMTNRPELQLYQNTLWMTVLRSLGAYQMYRQYVRRRVRGPDVINFLLLDADFPHAVAHCLSEVTGALKKLPDSGEIVASVLSTRAELHLIDPQALDAAGIHRMSDDLQLKIGGLHEQLTGQWLRLDNPS
jgi:uncharacterized alpha-E superfamily protein